MRLTSRKALPILTLRSHRRGRSMFGNNFRRDKLCDGEATQRDYDPVIGIPHYRNKIWYQVDRA
jgi:hypothetical protein